MKISKKEILKRIPILDLKKQYSIIRNKEVKTSIRTLLALNILFSSLYFVLPVDIIPDVIIGIGYIDDFSLYFLFREIGYIGEENDCGIQNSVLKFLKSKIILVLLIILVVLLSIPVILKILI
jgi:hypothetical protein